MKEMIAVFAGGGLGCLLRYLFSRLLNPLLTFMPIGTFAANLLACMVLGVISGIALSRLPQDYFFRLFMITGFCGGLSTFSTFNHELFVYIKNGQWLNAIVYLGLSLIICTFGIILGYKMSRIF